MTTKFELDDCEPLISPETPFLRKLFEAFNSADIEYCVLRNYEGLPLALNGHDLDVLVAKRNVLLATELIEEVAQSNKGYAIWREWNDYLRVVFCTGVGDDNRRWGVHVDLLTAIRWHGCEYYNSEKVLLRAIAKGGIRVAEVCDANLIAFLDKLLSYKDFNYKTYASWAAAIYPKMLSSVKEELRYVFGKDNAEFIFRFLEGEHFHFREIKALRKKLKLGLLIRQVLRFPLKTIRNKFKRFEVHCHRMIRRPGVFVVIIGCDGAGKTTLIDMLRQELCRITHWLPEKSFHRPNLLPRLSVLFGKDIGPVVSANPNPHAQPPNGIIISLFKLAYYAVDYIVGYWLRVYPHLVKPPMIFLFDRYFYDYFVDPTRWRVRVPNWILMAVECFVPKPDLVFMLKGDPEKFYSRKPELPAEELKKQMERMDNLSRRLNHVVWVDTSGSIEVSLRQILDAVLQALVRQPGWSRTVSKEKEPKF